MRSYNTLYEAINIMAAVRDILNSNDILLSQQCISGGIKKNFNDLEYRMF